MNFLGFVVVAVAAVIAGAIPGLVGALAGKRLTKEQQGFLPAIGVAVALAIVIPVGLQLRPAGISWVPYASTDGGFRVQFPGVPQPSSVSAGPKDRPVNVRQFIVHWPPHAEGEPERPGTLSLDCVVAYIDYAKAELAGTKAEDVLASARDGAVKQGKGKLTEETAIQVGDYPGKEIKIEQDEAWVYSRLVLANERLYVVTVATPAGVDRPAEVGTFFESFAIER